MLLADIKSAGNGSSCKTSTISPIFNWPLVVFSQLPLLYDEVGSMFCSLSNFALWQSSIPSRIIDTDKTIIIGTTAVAGAKGEIIGIHCKIAETNLEISHIKIGAIGNF